VTLPSTERDERHRQPLMPVRRVWALPPVLPAVEVTGVPGRDRCLAQPGCGVDHTYPRSRSPSRWPEAIICSMIPYARSSWVVRTVGRFAFFTIRALV